MKRLALIFVGLAGTALGACGEPGVGRLSEAELATVDRGRVRLSTALMQSLPAAARQLSLPSDAGAFSQPHSLSFTGWPVCELVIADGERRVVDVFSAGGEYLRSLPLVGPAADFGGPFRVLVAPNGSIVVSEGSLGRLAVARHSRLPWRVVNPGLVLKESRKGSALAARADGSILDHWFAAGETRAGGQWGENLPLMRILSEDGVTKGTLGRLRRFSGRSFTVALNRGIPVVDGDTVLFARRADGRILKFVAATGDSLPHSIVDLPVSFEMRAPLEQRPESDGAVFRMIDDHLTAFAVHPSGKFYAGIALSYPPGRFPGGQPRGALGIFDRAGSLLGLYDVGGVVRALAVSGHAVFALLDTASTRGRRAPWVVRVFPDPLERSAPSRSAPSLQRVRSPTTSGASSCDVS